MENGGRDSPVLSLQWHQHHSTIVSLLDNLWERQELVDVTLAAEGQSLCVHRIVLCACSKYFQELLTNTKTLEKQAIIFLKDVSFSNLKALVDYMYKGEVRIDEDQLEPFLSTAKSLGIRGLIGNSRSNEPEASKKRRRNCSAEESNQTSHTPRQSSDEIKNEPITENSQPEQNLFVHPPSIQSETDEEELEMFQAIDNNQINSLTNQHDHTHLPGPSHQTTHEMHVPSHDVFDEQHEWRNGPVDNAHNPTNPDPVPGRHFCPRCGRTYKWRQTMLRHMKYECGVEPQFVCPICRGMFHYKNVLQRHMNLHNRGVETESILRTKNF